MSKLAPAILVTFILSVTPSSSAHAIDVERVAGHQITIAGEYPTKELKVDGKTYHTDAIISFDEIIVVDGTVTLIGSSSAGGNACDSSPFVLSFPSESEPRFDGPLDNCVVVNHEIENGKVVFATGVIPGRDQNTWVWTPSAGFSEVKAVPFRADSRTNWTQLRERKLDHPSDAFVNGEIHQALKNVLGADFGHFQQLMAGVGSGEFKGDDYVGTACRPHDCPAEGGMIFLSPSLKRAFAAWKPEGGKIIVYPSPVKDWPEKARLELKNWARDWK